MRAEGSEAEDAGTTVLYVAHNHPHVRPGGAEAYALELYGAIRATPGHDAFFLAKGGPPLSPVGRLHLGTYIAPVGRDEQQYFMFTDGYDYDWLNGTMHNKEFYSWHFTSFLTAVRPDVVHFQHTMFFGYDLLLATRRALPDAPIVYTLHEFMPICHRQGQMVRTVDGSPCDEESPRRCHECFPDVSPQAFFLRKRFVQSHLSLVDRFIAPSAFLRDRYVDWGIPAERIVVEEYGRRPMGRSAEADLPRPRRDRIGFFGQLTQFKGADVLLEAMVLLQQDPPRPASSAAGAPDDDQGGPTVRAWVHGANLDLQPGEYQNRFRALLEETAPSVRMLGRYAADDIGSLMAAVDWVVVPSIWWENSPLVIQEAFAHGRPVICSDIGGMAEKVTDGVNGLHFRVGDPRSLADAIRRAVETPGLWEHLRAGISPPYEMDRHVPRITSLYRELIETPRAAVTP
jgi:glycosyltransferase involved in cell wall biosynthesis